MAPMNIKLTQTQFSQGTNSQRGRVEPRRYISCALRNSREASLKFEPRSSRSAVERAATGPTRPITCLHEVCLMLAFYYMGSNMPIATCPV